MAEYGIRLRFDNREVTEGLERNAASFDDVSKEVNRFERTSSQASTNAARDLKRVESQGNNLIKTFGRIGAAIGVAFGVRSVVNFGKAAVQAAGDYEQLGIAVETFVGSQEKANRLLLQAQEFSVRTPFTPDEVNETTRALLAFGFEQERILPTLQTVGDVAAGTGKNFQDLATIYGQVSIAGRLQGEQLRSFTLAGIPLLTELANNLGRTEQEIRDMVSAGEIGFTDVEQAFQTMTSEGGSFFDLMNRQSETFQGRVSTLAGLFNDVRRELGQELLPTFAQATERGIEFIESLDLDRLREFARTIGDGIGLLIEYGPLLLKTAAAFAVVTTANRLATASLLRQNEAKEQARQREMELQNLQVQARSSQDALTLARQRYVAALAASNKEQGRSIVLNKELAAARRDYRNAQLGATRATEAYDNAANAATGSTQRFTLAQRAGALAARGKAIALNLVRGALSALGIGLVIQGVTALIQNWERLTDVLQGVSRAQRAVNNASEDLRKEYIREGAEVVNLFNVLRDHNATKGEQREAIERLNQEYPEILKNYDLENASLREIAQAQKDVTESIFETARARLIEERVVESLEKQAEIQQEINRIQTEGLNAWRDGLFITEEQALSSQQKRLDQERERINQTVEGIRSLTEFDIFNQEQITEAQAAQFDRRRQQAIAYYNEVKDLSADQLQDELMNNQIEIDAAREKLNQLIALQEIRRQNAARLGQELSSLDESTFEAERSALEETLRVLESNNDQLDELLSQRNENRKNRNDQAIADNEEFNKELERLQSETAELIRDRELEGADGIRERLSKEREFLMEDLREREQIALQAAQTPRQRAEIEEAFAQFRLETEREFNRREIEEIQKHNQDRDREFQRRQQTLIRAIDTELRIREEQIDAEIASGQLSIEQIRDLEEEKLQVQLETEQRKRDTLLNTIQQTQAAIIEAEEAGDTDRVQDLEAVLSQETQAYERQAAAVIRSRNDLNRTILENQQAFLQESEDQRLREIDRELRFGELSNEQRRELELQKLEIIRQSAQAQLELFDGVQNEETLRLQNLIADTEAEIDQMERVVLRRFRDFGDMLNSAIRDAFGVDSEEAEEIISGLGELKGAVTEFLTSAADAEIAQIDRVISARQDSIRSLETDLDRELRAKENGFANNYDLLREQLDDERELLAEEQRRREELERKRLRQQAIVDSAEQAGALATAVANIIRSESRLGLAGIITAGVAIASLFGIWKRYRAQTKEVTDVDVPLYKGGRIRDHLRTGQSPRSDKPGYGRGHRVEGTNIRLGADEFITNEDTTKEQYDFLKKMNDGRYKGLDLHSLAERALSGPEQKPLSEIFRKAPVKLSVYKEAQQAQTGTLDAKTQKRIYKEALREELASQNQLMIDLDSRRPVVINHANGDVEILEYERGGGVKRRIERKKH